MFHSVKQFYSIWQPKFSPRNKSMLAQCIKSKRQKKKKKKKKKSEMMVMIENFIDEKKINFLGQKNRKNSARRGVGQSL